MHDEDPLYKNKPLSPILKHEQLTKLDVDEDIWQDCIMDGFKVGSLPPWLTDGRVREGICYAQELKNCNHELNRLMAEHANLHQWLITKFQSYQDLLNSCVFSGAASLSFFALLHLHELYCLSIEW